ncbi:ThiJ/PfpI domain protein [Catenulispora acidiphila DSM 44928]|uniref:ThiJ/PfpI domain protein n=1 Tax=Catenulispora acidiphila (strain DSM 44928 / JCM 14897 / NBRC 102108 / NRRL B-24433 / ID139908) TaxID=479433 RepID=C7PXY7_CATAD|nr:type 1 glutamine amidotransferase domain-containing protein [Catenulispora acidiphila]ACU73447.1 ThiJ/PfpI domain protein [Catenulispora acidiphila DSM 44928]
MSEQPPAADRPRVLFIVSAAHQLTMKDATLLTTGFWAEELLVPHQAFTQAGFDVKFATPAGLVPQPDPRSLNAHDGAELDHLPDLRTPLVLDDVELDGYEALFVPGGHAPLEDLATDRVAGTLITDALTAGKPVGAVCHGPAAFLAAHRPDGTPAIAGYRITAFTDEEERQGGLADNMRYLLEDKLVELGADFVQGPAFHEHTETDRNLHTGQNPQSSAQIAADMLEALGR